MATITYKIEEPKKDKTRKVSITLSHKGIRKRIHTNIIIKECDLTKQGKIKSDSLKRNIEDTVNTLKNRLYEIETSLGNKDADIEWIYSQLTGNRIFH